MIIRVSTVLFFGAVLLLAAVVTGLGDWLHSAFGLPADLPWKLLDYAFLAVVAFLAVGAVVSARDWFRAQVQLSRYRRSRTPEEAAAEAESAASVVQLARLVDPSLSTRQLDDLRRGAKSLAERDAAQRKSRP